MAELSISRLEEYRTAAFRSSNNLRIHHARQAVDFVNERGFIFFWPIKNMTLPSLWVAAAGDREVPNDHDDPGHVTWGWKDHNLDKRVWYYSRLLRRRNTIVALDLIPYFYALSPNYGSPEDDYLIEYEEGHMPQETRLVYEALLKEGQLDTIALRRAAHLTAATSDNAFNRALEQLQVDLRILPIGISEAGAWKYSFIYAPVHRYFPDLLEQARNISEHEARRVLLEKYFQSVGAARQADVIRLFNIYRSEDMERALQQLVQAGKLVPDCQLPSEKNSFLALPILV